MAQSKVKSGAVFPYQYIAGDGSTQWSSKPGIEGLNFEQYVDDSGNTWVRIAGTGLAGGSIDTTSSASSIRPLAVDSLGRLILAPGQSVSTAGTRKTYSASVNAHAPAATPTDWFTIAGAAGLVIRITQISVALRATAANQYPVKITKYSALYSSGTSAAVTAVTHDSADPVSGATVLTWASGLPTVGTLVGAVTSDSLPVGVLGTPTFDNEPSSALYEFGVRGEKPLTIRGQNEYVSLNSGGTALPSGMVADVRITWTEDVS